MVWFLHNLWLPVYEKEQRETNIFRHVAMVMAIEKLRVNMIYFTRTCL